VTAPGNGYSRRMIQQDDRVLPITRMVAAVVAAILALATWVLYLHPTDTARHFAWTIKPTMTPLWMGAGYGSAMYFYLRMLGGRRWHHFTVGFIPTTVFTWLMLAATILHWSKFHHGQLAFMFWLWVYIVTPVLVPAVWLINRRTDPGTLESRDARLPKPIRSSMIVVGVGLCAVSAWMFLFPASAIAYWPWMLTPLTARVISAFIAIPGVTWLTMARDGRWSACRIPIQTTAISIVLMGIGLVRARSDLDQGSPLTWVFVAGMAGTLLALAALAIAMERLAAAPDRGHNENAESPPKPQLA
jgi:hypothetical protein